MRRLTKTGYVIAGTTAAAVLLGGGIAYAYWTSSGTGTGSAAAGTTANVTVTQDALAPITGLYPDGPAQNIAITVANPNDTAVKLKEVSAVVSGTNKAGCTVNDFLITGLAYGGGTIAGNGSVTSSTATIEMVNDLARNQDACKNATVSLAFTATAAP